MIYLRPSLGGFYSTFDDFSCPCDMHAWLRHCVISAWRNFRDYWKVHQNVYSHVKMSTLKLVRTNLNYRWTKPQSLKWPLSLPLCTYYLGWMPCLISFVWGQSSCQVHGTSLNYKILVHSWNRTYAALGSPRLRDQSLIHLARSQPCHTRRQYPVLARGSFYSIGSIEL